MDSLPEYLTEYKNILRKIFSNKLAQEEIEIIILLLHESFSQRNLALLISESFEVDYYKTLNSVYGVGMNEGEKNAEKIVEIKDKLVENNFDF